MSYKILITGGGGQVARSIVSLSEEFDQFELIPLTREQLDICHLDEVRKCMREKSAQAVINCAAYTNVDKAESDSLQAFEVNEKGAGNIAKTCAELDIPCIHISSDYVYHSGTDVPFKEDSPTLPRGVYAHSKLAGEQAVLRMHPRSTIVRSSWIYSAYGHNFVKTMLRLGKENRTLRVVIDQIGTPTYAPDLGRALLSILNKILIGNENVGLGQIYNYSNNGMCSWYYFARCIFEYAHMSVKVVPVESSEFPRPAPRPSWSVMSLDKIKRDFDLEIPDWKYSLKRCLSEIADQTIDEVQS